MNAYINSYAANVFKGYEQDPSRYITVEYFFGICNDSVVENIIVENVTAPVAGEKPNYNWSIRGNGYQMDISHNNETYGVKNGLQWWDTTTGSWEYVYANDSFIAGHTYVCQLYLVVEDGYNFRNMTTHSALPTATINGNTAEINAGWTNATEARVYYTFTCGARTVDTITITDLEDPVGGNTPDATVTVGDSNSYTVESIQWFDIEENPVGATFETGVPYYALITVAPATGVVFADAENINVYVNGNILSGIKVENNKVIIPVIIRKPSSAPIGNPYGFTTQPEGGTVNAGQTHTAYWQTTFIPTDTEIQYWDGEAWDQWDIQQAQAAVDSYDFVNADEGSYHFRIVAYIGNDAVATSNEFVITWEDITYTVSFNANGGTGAMFDETEQLGGYVLPECGFTAPTGKQFKCWAEGSTSGQKYDVGYEYDVTANVTFYAVWENIPVTNYTITATAGANGTISPSGEVTVAEGEDKTFTITANSGYHIKDVKVNGSSVGAVATYTFNDVAANVTITVEFEVDTVPHVCNPTLVLEDEPDCTTAGKSAYYHCEYGKNYEDAQKQHEIANIETWGILNALDHDPSTAWSNDGEYHWKECTRCAGQQLEKAAHSDSDNNGKCDTCGADVPVTPPDHTHDHGTTWKTDANEHWNECTCGDKANKAAHINDNGDNKCDTCDYAMPAHDPDNPDEPNGLSGGAIAGIVVGSVVVLGLGGFAIVWFVIKKKTWAEFLAIFKKK